jgi:hypothetical protein
MTTIITAKHARTLIEKMERLANASSPHTPRMEKSLKMKSLTTCLLVIGLIACGDNSTPTSPPPPALAKANIVTSGSINWINCFFGSCFAQGDARNLGPGCARAVRGVLRFFNGAGAQSGPSYSWSLASDIVVRANEIFTYRPTERVPPDIAYEVGTYRTEFSWTDTAC